MSAGKTYLDLITWIAAQPASAWTARWWTPGAELIVTVPDAKIAAGRVMAVKDARQTVPQGVLALGTTGLNPAGQFEWLGWDFDVGDHGAASYPSLAAATASAMGLRHYLDCNAEVRLSKSGNGVHVRKKLPQPLPKEQGLKFSKAVVDALGLRADRTPIGRQQFWLWVRKPAKNAFQLIADMQPEASP